MNWAVNNIGVSACNWGDRACGARSINGVYGRDQSTFITSQLIDGLVRTGGLQHECRVSALKERRKLSKVPLREIKRRVLKVLHA